VTELISVLDTDSDLAELVPQERRPQARRAAAAALMRLPVGRWEAGRDADRARGGYGLLIVEGMLIREVGLHRRFGAELLSVGDLLRPWQHDGEGADGTLPFEWQWRVVVPTRLAILDLHWAARVTPWPQLGAELAGRALARSLRLAVAMVISQHPKLETRLLLLFWDLADRYGRVRRDGVHVELPLTHEVLSHLAGARRPSVSGALSRLAAAGRLRRDGRTWVLLGEPPSVEDPEVALPAGPLRESA
jgi:CRP/FNR family transcriptional regulator, cyclic AMP receptor protein